MEKTRIIKGDSQIICPLILAYFDSHQYLKMTDGTVIIGNGIAGITAARELRKRSKQRIQVISSETPYFFSRTALMYVYMGHMKFEQTKPYENWVWEKNKIDLVQALVEKVNHKENTLVLSTGERLKYDNLLIASVTKPKYYGWKGQNLKSVQVLVSYQGLQELEANMPATFLKDHPTKKVKLVGSGEIGVVI